MRYTHPKYLMGTRREGGKTKSEKRKKEKKGRQNFGALKLRNKFEETTPKNNSAGPQPPVRQDPLPSPTVGHNTGCAMPRLSNGVTCGNISCYKVTLRQKMRCDTPKSVPSEITRNQEQKEPARLDESNAERRTPMPRTDTQTRTKGREEYSRIHEFVISTVVTIHRRNNAAMTAAFRIHSG